MPIARYAIHGKCRRDVPHLIAGFSISLTTGLILYMIQNTVQNVPGVAIAAGYGTFLRNVTISGNVVSESRIGIGVSVVDGAGNVHIGGNAIAAREHAMVGLAWQEIVELDLVGNAERYPNVVLTST